MRYSDHAQVNALLAQAYLQDVTPARRQRRVQASAAAQIRSSPTLFVLPKKIKGPRSGLQPEVGAGFRPPHIC